MRLTAAGWGPNASEQTCAGGGAVRLLGGGALSVVRIFGAAEAAMLRWSALSSALPATGRGILYVGVVERVLGWGRSSVFCHRDGGNLSGPALLSCCGALLLLR